jgi:hypothetical protein
MDQLDRYFNPISFAIDEQLITFGAVLSGYLNFSHRKIIVALIIMAFSSSLPDVLSYYDEQITDGEKREEALKMAFIVFISEIMAAMLVISPLLFINNIKIGITISYILICIILLLTNYYRDKDLYQSLMKLPLYILVCLTVWFISKITHKYFKI